MQPCPPGRSTNTHATSIQAPITNTPSKRTQHSTPTPSPPTRTPNTPKTPRRLKLEASRPNTQNASQDAMKIRAPPRDLRIPYPTRPYRIPLIGRFRNPTRPLNQRHDGQQTTVQSKGRARVPTLSILRTRALVFCLLTSYPPCRMPAWMRAGCQKDPWFGSMDTRVELASKPALCSLRSTG